MFNLHDYVMDLIKKMINNGVADYKVMKFALDYYEKEVLTDEDMQEIEELLNPIKIENSDIEVDGDNAKDFNLELEEEEV